MPSKPKLHHDTVLHDCGGGRRGPVTPVDTRRPHEASQPDHVRCAACGDDWIEMDPGRLAWVWWSRGAWDERRKQRTPEGNRR